VPAHWTAAEPPVWDEWDIKGLLETAVALANPDASVQVDGTAWIARHPDGTVVGWAGALEADSPPWAAPLYGFEVRIDPTPRPAPRFHPLPATPAAERVFALLLPDGLEVARVDEVLRRTGGALLESVEIVSQYRGDPVPAGHRSVAVRLIFRAPDRTLRDAEVDAAEQRLLGALRSELNLQRREAGAVPDVQE
jgi:phenylalanyl-tRNA synthetase beta chain